MYKYTHGHAAIATKQHTTTSNLDQYQQSMISAL